jgi:hypothetical protein
MVRESCMSTKFKRCCGQVMRRLTGRLQYGFTIRFNKRIFKYPSTSSHLLAAYQSICVFVFRIVLEGCGC